MFPLRQVGEIELTSRCNLRCRYCPSPKLTRPKLDMTRDVFARALHWASVLAAASGTPPDVSFSGLGEPTLHREFPLFLRVARNLLGPAARLTVVTNGLLVDDRAARVLADTATMAVVSVHRPEKAGPAVEALRNAGVAAMVTGEHASTPHDWAGQVKWPRYSEGPQPCRWVPAGRVHVLADGRVTRCPMDASGVGVFAHVDDAPEGRSTSPYALCNGCHCSLGFRNQLTETGERKFRWIA